MRCSGSRVFLPPSHVNESFTAAIVVRSLLAAVGEVWVAGLVVGRVVGRGGWFWLLARDVVVAVDIGTWSLLEGWMEGPPAKTADRPVAARVWKSHWLVTVLEAYGGRLAIGATMEPPVTERGSSRAKSASEQGNGPFQSTAENGRENSPKAGVYEQFNIFDQLFDTVGAGCKNRAIIPATPSVASQEPRS